jgi:hypothetical protein
MRLAYSSEAEGLLDRLYRKERKVEAKLVSDWQCSSIQSKSGSMTLFWHAP